MTFLIFQTLNPKTNEKNQRKTTTTISASPHSHHPVSKVLGQEEAKILSKIFIQFLTVKEMEFL